MIIHLATDNILKELVMIGSLKIISECKRNIDNDDAKKGAPDDLRVLTIRLTLDRLIARHTRYGKKYIVHYPYYWLQQLKNGLTSLDE